MKEEPPVPVAPATISGRLDHIARHAAYGLAAEIRAVESGHNARVLPDGSILVKSDSQPGSHRVWIRGVRDGTVLLGCTCRSGTHRASLPVPCKHAALAGRRLERERLATWHDGTWWLRERAEVQGLRLLLATTIGRQAGTAATRPVPAEQLQHATEAA
ncbi:MAG TPA: hypothetical protein VFA46_00565 [Actinomycetes bacterium]|jgi:hypothetical protein|nr:hypothetical protein [Actinomycetes bacterium]